MTAVDENATTAGTDTGGPSPDAAAPGTRNWRSVWRDTRWLALEIVALTTFVFARPVLAAMGASSETFITRGADWTDVLGYLVLIVAVPPVVLFGVEVVARLVDARALRPVHALIVGVGASFAVWEIAEQSRDLTAFPVALPLVALAGAAVAALRLRTQALGTFLRYGSLIVLVVVGQFAFASKTGQILLGGRHVGVSSEARDAVAAAVGDDGPPVVVMVFDGMPTELLMDGEGGIDGELYPNLAALAGRSTWYRNHTTVAPMTLQAVPSILAGDAGSGDDAPVASTFPENLFTLLGGTYEVDALEPLTALCPASMCPEDTGFPVNDLVGDSVDVWRQQLGGQDDPGFFVPGAFEDRYARTQAWLAAQDFAPGDRPSFHMMHMLVPHDPWTFLPDGRAYQDASGNPTGMLAYRWSAVGAEVGRQRHILQMQLADRFVGQVMDKLRDAGTYDEALMVVTADHGYAFHDEGPVRGVSDENYDEIMWTPLIVKAPGQQDGAVDDRNVKSVDVMPTIADELGIELPWDDLDGVPASTADRDPGDKAIADWGLSDLRSEDGEPIEVDGEAGFARVIDGDAVAGTGPLALWDRTGGAHGGLVGRSVDELAVGDPVPQPLEVTGLERWEAVDVGRPPIEVFGFTGREPGETVALAVNGRIAAAVPTAVGAYGLTMVDALLWPDALVDGDNDLAAYVVDGEPDAPVLHPFTLNGR